MEKSTAVARQVKVYGKVQGVFYRASTKCKALELGLKGWVKNQIDGTVLFCAAGSKDEVEALTNWSKTGPKFASVERIEVVEVEVQNFDGFEIRY